MVMHEGLPVYREAYSLLVETYSITKQFSKDTKYTLGTTLRESSFQIVRGIAQANANMDTHTRSEFIQHSIQALEDFRLAFRVSRDLHEVSTKRFAHISPSVESISKQLFAWHKSMSARKG